MFEFHKEKIKRLSTPEKLKYMHELMYKISIQIQKPINIELKFEPENKTTYHVRYNNNYIISNSNLNSFITQIFKLLENPRESLVQLKELDIPLEPAEQRWPEVFHA